MRVVRAAGRHGGTLEPRPRSVYNAHKNVPSRKEKSMKRVLAAAAALLAISLSASALTITFPKIDRKPKAADFNAYFKPRTSIPHYDPTSTQGSQVDLRSTDLSAADALSSLSDLLFADFDDDTIWPKPDKMPKGFDPAAIMELGKDPGLGVRTLHAQGITGKNVGIAIIDQPLLTDHVEYATQLRLYEEQYIQPGTESQMHGPAVASIAVGKTVGVAPEADLYYIAGWPGTWDGRGGFAYDFSNTAQSIRRIMEINASLPRDRKIRVISISVGWSNSQKGYADVMAAVAEAKKAGLLVVSSSLQATFGLAFDALGRAPMADPNAFESYEPGLWLAAGFFSREPTTRYRSSDLLWIPMDSRTTASPTGSSKYVFYRAGGWSWSIPYIAGLYALACQVDPSVTPDSFWKKAMETGRTIQVAHEGKSYPLGPIVDPVSLMRSLGK
jgi:hypothetical protein